MCTMAPAAASVSRTSVLGVRRWTSFASQFDRTHTSCWHELASQSRRRSPKMCSPVLDDRERPWRFLE